MNRGLARASKQRIGSIATLLALSVVPACSSLGPEDVVGTYTATTLLYSGDESGDFLEEGGSLTITLNAAGATSGTMIVPASLTESGSMETFDLSGTWMLLEDQEIVEFEHSADTFIRDTQWEATGSELIANPMFGDTTLEAVLTSQ